MDKEVAEFSEMTHNQKESYFYDLSVKLNDPHTSPETYWSIIKSCYNGRKIQKIPLLSVNGNVITNFKEKTNLFNKYFSRQCNPLPNNNKLPENQTYITETKLSSFDIEDEDIYKIIKTLDINKAYGHHEISIRMLKLCDGSIAKPLPIIIKTCKIKKTFPDLRKKANVVPIHNNAEKNLINNYYPVSLLLIFGKFLKDCYLTLFLNTLMKINCLILASQVFIHLIPL